MPDKTHRSHRSKYSNKDNRLCKQIETELLVLFAGAAEDERLNQLGVASVEPAPDISCLLVTVYPLYETDQPEPETILAWLHSAKSFLRQEIAAAINRRRVPELTFRVVPGAEEC
ncbi:MAG: ribosome-binding factor A [bacterium]|nr:ribosome-binding factor A [bacterium]